MFAISLTCWNLWSYLFLIAFLTILLLLGWNGLCLFILMVELFESGHDYYSTMVLILVLELVLVRALSRLRSNYTSSLQIPLPLKPYLKPHYKFKVLYTNHDVLSYGWIDPIHKFL